jgi:ubiquinone biosynthesis protein COQ4
MRTSAARTGSTPSSASRIDLAAALQAARALVENPDDTSKVFTILEALGGRTAERVARRFAADPTGARLLREQPDIVPLLADRETLRRMPEGSLARAYLDFVESEGITADGLVAASKEGHQKDRKYPPEQAWVRKRLRDTHDLWHATNGYKGDVLGEIAQLAFILPQTRNPALALIILAALLRYRSRASFSLITAGFRRGLRAQWLPAQDWESLLALPVDEVRRRLGVGDPPQYVPLRSSELRAMGVIGTVRPAAA